MGQWSLDNASSNESGMAHLEACCNNAGVIFSKDGNWIQYVIDMD